MAARRARRSPTKNRKQAPADDGIQSAPLEPIDYVERELTRPDGSSVMVKVPVYPPFKLQDRATESQKKAS